MSVSRAAFSWLVCGCRKKTKIGDPLQKVTVAGDGIIYAGWGVGETVLLPDVKKRRISSAGLGRRK